MGADVAGPEPTAASGAEAVVHALLSTARVIARHFDARLAEHELPVRLSGPRLRMLIAVHDAGRMRMGDLAQALGITPRTVTTLVDSLERDGQLRRLPDPTDRRATLLELTQKARTHFERVQSLQHQLSEDVARSLGEDQRCQLLALLDRIKQDAIRAGAGEPCAE